MNGRTAVLQICRQADIQPGPRPWTRRLWALRMIMAWVILERTWGLDWCERLAGLRDAIWVLTKRR
jgi:hypothetical protein